MNAGASEISEMERRNRSRQRRCARSIPRSAIIETPGASAKSCLRSMLGDLVQ
jgi:hypothetical protein